MKQLNIGYLSTMYHTSHIVKAEKWIENDMHIIPEWHLFPTGPAMVEAFSTSSIDIGYIGLPPAMIGIEKGIPIICIAGGHVEGTVMIAHKEYRSFEELHSTEQVFQQLRGKTLGTPTRGSIHDVIIRHLIEQRGGTIAIRNFSWADLIPEAIEHGELVGAVGTPPLAILCAEQCDTKVLIPPSELWPFNPSYGIVVRKALLGENTLLEDFLLLHEKACNLIRNNPDEASAIVSDELKAINSTFVKRVFRLSPKYCASVPEAYIGSTMSFIAVLRKLDYIKKVLMQEDIFELTIIKKVHPHPAHYDDPGNLLP